MTVYIMIRASIEEPCNELDHIEGIFLINAKAHQLKKKLEKENSAGYEYRIEGHRVQ